MSIRFRDIRLAATFLLFLSCSRSFAQQKSFDGNGSLGPGDHPRSLMLDGHRRSYLVHVPRKYDSKKPSPVVLALHGALMDSSMMAGFSGLNETSNEAGFLVVYPDGTGFGPFRLWNAGGLRGSFANLKADDIGFIKKLLDDLKRVVNVDPKKVYATGMSNGAMMCYRLAAELSDRIAAIAPVAGTMAIEDARPKRYVSVIHFHGTADRVVPFDRPESGTVKFESFKSVEESIRIWCRINKCPRRPAITGFPYRDEAGTMVKQKRYGPGKDGAEVVLIEIEGGGHTWPGRKPWFDVIGKSTTLISANDLIWEFFKRHAMP